MASEGTFYDEIIEFDIGDSGEQNTITGFINGYLETVYIDSDPRLLPVQVSIKSEDIPELELLHYQNIPPFFAIIRHQPVDEKAKPLTFGVCQIALGERLAINIRAGKGTKGVVRIRWRSAGE